jgi:hypothetical protein
MSKTIWVINLPDEVEIYVDQGDKVIADDVLAESDDREYTSPTAGKVIEISDEKLKLEFKAKKVSGIGVGKGRGWGEICYQPEVNYQQLDCDYQGKIVVINPAGFTAFFVSKARTLGVKGIVVLTEKTDEIKAPLPILAVDKKGSDLIKENSGVKCLLDAKNGYLLIPTKS